jgi:hypothetical protein
MKSTEMSPVTKVRSGFVLVIVCAAMSALPLLAAQPKTPEASSHTAAQTFSGEIMDALCAKDGTHEGMMQEMKSMGRDKATCTLKCAQLGAKYVLFDAATKQVYGLDDQEKAEAFAGKRVRVSGTLQKNKIKVDSIAGAD